jgi:hypothetical protein
MGVRVIKLNSDYIIETVNKLCMLKNEMIFKITFTLVL